jgi:hypothetical protein
MLFQVLSVVAPAGSRIRSRRKTIEVRRWALDALPLRNLVIVQNDIRLTDENPEDATGRIVAVVDVVAIREWLAEDLEKSSATEFQEGFLAWELENIRPAAYHRFVPAKLGIYELDLDPKFLVYPEGSLAEIQKEQAAAAEAPSEEA